MLLLGGLSDSGNERASERVKVLDALGTIEFEWASDSDDEMTMVMVMVTNLN